MAARPYNPGTPTAAQPDRDGTFLVKSFRGERAAYRVDLQAATCTCPHFERRLAGTGQECKHLSSARQQALWLGHVAKARLLTDGELNRLLVKYQEQRPDIAGAIRVVRHERRQQEKARDAEWEAMAA